MHKLIENMYRHHSWDLGRGVGAGVPCDFATSYAFSRDFRTCEIWNAICNNAVSHYQWISAVQPPHHRLFPPQGHTPLPCIQYAPHRVSFLFICVSVCFALRGVAVKVEDLVGMLMCTCMTYETVSWATCKLTYCTPTAGRNLALCYWRVR